MVHPDRIHTLRDGPQGRGPVVYWMSRDQRCGDNWALLAAQERALEAGAPLVAAFCLAPSFPGACLRHYDFLLRGLARTGGALGKLNIGFALLSDEPWKTLPRLLERIDAGLLVTDFDPMKVKRAWVRRVLEATSLPAVEVDAHNIVPCRAASDKQEYAARTIRPKLHRLLPEFLDPIPAPVRHPHAPPKLDTPDWDAALAFVAPDRTVGIIEAVAPGQDAGLAALEEFAAHGLKGYDEGRNDPNAGAQSGLSPWLHFGQLSAQRSALAALDSPAPRQDRDAFLEELIVRRELSDNFCLHNEHHDSLLGAADWALKTLDEHRGDPREHVYTLEEFETCRTHSALWNAAQTEMMRTGRMHGYMRMYWAKKILQWTATPEDAVNIALTLNDRFSLDGRDPNGNVGVLWSVAGLHDRAWTERPVFGKIRYMNERGCRRKFDVDAYVARWLERQRK